VALPKSDSDVHDRYPPVAGVTDRLTNALKCSRSVGLARNHADLKIHDQQGGNSVIHTAAYSLSREAS
jgi:hypothetical protein